jgi:phosphoglycolate phosphatase-like HAD superfamily hydrolase
MRVVLFDIDGTLLSTLGSGSRAMKAALIEHFGTPGDPSYRYDGKTDRQIARELMRRAGFEDPVIDERMPKLFDSYIANLRREVRASPESISVYPGVLALLGVLHARDDVTVGLLTGNIEPGARIKLDSAGLDIGDFRVGAFGSDHERRDELPAIARDRASALLAREVSGDSLVIIGDTPFDIACGRGVCARAIGVATGHYDVSSLSEHQPAAVFADLSNTDLVLEAIFGD